MRVQAHAHFTSSDHICSVEARTLVETLNLYFIALKNSRLRREHHVWTRTQGSRLTLLMNFVQFSLAQIFDIVAALLHPPRKIRCLLRLV
jgi:hypothetical protein